MLTIYFNNFWSGFQNSADIYLVFFKKIFNQEIKLIDNKDSDILCESVFYGNSCLDYKKYKYSFLISFENNLVNEKYLDKYSCILSGFTGEKNRIILPYFNWRIFETDIKFLPIKEIPKKSICGVISNGNSIRNNILVELNKIIKIDFGGRFMNNIKRIEGTHADMNLIEFYQGYKFVLAFENSIGDYYITEKIFNVLRAGVIPIYFGTSKICEIINPKRYIQIKDSSKEEIERVTDLVKNITDEEFIKTISEPVLIKPIDLLFEETINDIKKLIFASH